jgi:hypothetical protein
LKTRILKISLIVLSCLLSVNISKAQQYISSSSVTGYACYNFFDDNTAVNISPAVTTSSSTSVILSASTANTLSVVGTTGRCLQSNHLTVAVDAAINYIPNAADKTTYAANLNTKDWEWSLLYRSNLAGSAYPASTTGSTYPSTPISGAAFYAPLTGTTNAWKYWLHATAATATVGTQGFVLLQTSDGYLHVYCADGNASDNPIELAKSKAPLNNNTTYCIKVQRLINGTWNLYLDPYTSTVTQAATLQSNRVASDGYAPSLAYKNSILQTTQSATGSGTFQFDEMHMYSRYLYFSPMTTAAQGVTQSPLYAGETPVILYGIQIFTRGNYDFTQIYINETDNSYFRSNFVNNGSPASLYQTTNPVLSMTGATFVSNIQLNNGGGAMAQITAYTSPLVSMGNIDGSLSNPENYFIETSMAATINVPAPATMSFGTVSSVVDGTTGSPVPSGQFANGTPPAGTGTIGTGTVYDWVGGATGGNLYTIGANWHQGVAPSSTDVVNFGVNYSFTTTNSPIIKANTTVGQANVGKNGGNQVVFNLTTGSAGTSYTITNGITLAAGANLSLNGFSSSSHGTLVTQGTSTAASTSIIVPTNTTITQSGTFNLLSDADGTANIGILLNSTITGTFNVYRYFNGGTQALRTWRMISSPINNSTGAFNFANLQQTLIVTGTGGAASGFDPPASWGATGYTANGPTVIFYNEPNLTRNDYVVLSTNPSTTTKPVGTGFYFFYRGDRTHNVVSKIERVGGNYATPESTATIWTGSLNTGNISPTITFTNNVGATDNGFNMIGNPYPCTLDWTKVTAFSHLTLNSLYTGVPTIWGYDPTTNSTNPAGVGNIRNNVAIGQGFFVQANAASPSVTMTENAKTVAAVDQPTGSKLLFSLLKPKTDPYIQFEMIRDSANADFAYIHFNDSANPKYNKTDDIDDVNGNGQAVFFGSLTADSVEVAVNSMPLTKNTSFYLSVNATTQGAFSLKRTDLVNVSSAYDVFLMDHFLKDSLDLRQNDTYAFNITSDPNSYGNNRFQVIIRIKPLPPYRLLAFTGQHVSAGNQLNWKTANENYYTTFQVQRSIDKGQTFSSITTMQSDSSGQYTYTDKTPAKDTSMYRLMQSDVNDNITYSSIVIISTTGSLVDFKVYPNPASSYIQFQANSVVQPPLKLNIYNSVGSIVKTATFSANTGTQDLSGLINGTYILEIIDVNTKKSLGTAKFSKF